MFDTYKEIFDVRAMQYHFAMKLCCDAREQEFLNSIAIVQNYKTFNKNDKIIDIPAGGCYLKKYLPQEVQYIAFEESESFIKQTKYDQNIQVEYFANNLLTNLESNSVDFVFSIAGLHHNPNLLKLFQEIARVLHNKGLAIIADVGKDSNQDYFLNQFVDQNSSFKHKGIFLDDSTIKELQQANLEVVTDQNSQYYWQFADENNMVQFCKNLFGIDQATDDEILKAIKSYLGVKYEKDKLLMNWSLRNIVIKKKI